MKSHTGFLCLLLTVSLAFIATKQASALTYQQGAGVNFTFNSALSVTLSSSDIVINNLVAGTSSDSNIITVNVKTNSAGGYTLNATVGNSTYGHRNLANSNVAENFTSLDYGSSVASLNSFSDNKWGYSFSTNDGSSWSDYSGLPLYTDATNVSTLKATTGPSAVDGDNIKFKIGARASINQPSGEYKNVINFTVVAEPTTPMTLFDAYASANKTMLNGYYKMQDMNSTICSDVEVYGDDSAMQVIDIRDNKTYWIAKLADEECWMTQNLDHNIVTDGSVAYTSTTTDVPATWTPSTATYPTGTTTWNYSTTTPESYDPGALYWSGTPGDSTPVSTGDSHYHLGNYYNWTAAVAMNDSSSYTTDQQDANQSICPANWTLPKSGNVTTSGSFQYLVTQYGWDSSSRTMTNPNIWNSPIKASLSGYWYGSLGGVGENGTFWSPMVGASGRSYYLYASSDGFVNPDYNYNRVYGVSVRCLAR